jgi:flagella basal body P-ring formation protein FlgA
MTYFNAHKILPTLVMALSLVLLMGLPTTANAQNLKSAPMVDGDQITLGDLFKNAGSVSDIVVSNAPAPGQKLYLSIRDIGRIAAANGLKWEPKITRSTIIVKRTGRAISKSDLTRLLKEQISFEKSGNNFAVYLQGQNKPLYLPTSSETSDIVVESVNLDHRTGRFVAYLNIPESNTSTRQLEVRGKVEDLVSIPVLNHTMTPSEVITASDILWLDVPARTITQNTVQSQDLLLAMEPRRPLRANTPIRASDIRRPIVVKKGTIVTLTVSIGNLKMQSQGRALENAGKGDFVRVMNLDSRKTIEGIVTRSGRVEVLNRKSRALYAQN